MKISKARLKEIIQEEVQLYRNENRVESLIEYAEVKIEDSMNELHDSGVPNEELKAVLLKVVKNIDAGFVGEPS